MGIFNGVAVSKEDKQISPEALLRRQKNLDDSAGKAFSKLTSPSAEDRRLAAIQLRKLSDRRAGLKHRVSKAQVETLLKQIKNESSLAAQVAEISALVEVSNNAFEPNSKSSVIEFLKKMMSTDHDKEVVSESKYALHLIENGTEIESYIIFKEMGLKKEDFIKTDTMFAHEVFDYTTLKADALISKNEIIVPALKKILSTANNPVLLLEGLHIASLLGAKAEPIYSIIANLAEFPYWRVRKESINFLQLNSETNLLSDNVKKKLLNDTIPEISEHMKLLGINSNINRGAMSNEQ